MAHVAGISYLLETLLRCAGPAAISCAVQQKLPCSDNALQTLVRFHLNAELQRVVSVLLRGNGAMLSPELVTSVRGVRAAQRMCFPPPLTLLRPV